MIQATADLIGKIISIILTYSIHQEPTAAFVSDCIGRVNPDFIGLR